MPIITTTKTLRPRAKFDSYPTPVETVEAALDLVPVAFPQRILDPGAGNGVWGACARARWPGARIIGIEINEDIKPPYRTEFQVYNVWEYGDYLKSRRAEEADLIIGNPPYEFAEEFIYQSLDNLADKGYLLFLLRLAFLEGQKRGKGLWKEYPPMKVTACSKRPSYTGDGKTDATAYAVYLWQKGWHGTTELTWLEQKGAVG
jgi:hypothetical protein